MNYRAAAEPSEEHDRQREQTRHVEELGQHDDHGLRCSINLWNVRDEQRDAKIRREAELRRKASDKARRKRDDVHGEEPRRDNAQPARPHAQPPEAHLKPREHG